MADDNTKRENREAGRVGEDEIFEAAQLAKDASISVMEAKRLIRWHGNQRETLMREAKKLRAK